MFHSTDLLRRAGLSPHDKLQLTTTSSWSIATQYHWTLFQNGSLCSTARRSRTQRCIIACWSLSVTTLPARDARCRLLAIVHTFGHRAKNSLLTWQTSRHACTVTTTTRPDGQKFVHGRTALRKRSPEVACAHCSLRTPLLRRLPALERTRHRRIEITWALNSAKPWKLVKPQIEQTVLAQQ